MDELFKQMALLDDNESGEKLLRKYTDYREYLDYDIKITHEMVISQSFLRSIVKIRWRDTDTILCCDCFKL